MSDAKILTNRAPDDPKITRFASTFAIDLRVVVDSAVIESVIELVPSAIGYWTWSVDIVTSDTSDGILQFVIWEKNDDEDGPGNRHVLLRQDIVMGIARLLTGHVNVAGHIRQYIVNAVLDRDAVHIDVEATDAIVQAALFNELVYG